MKLKRLALLFFVVALVAAACGGDDTDDEVATEDTTEEGSGGGGEGECTLEEPLKFIGLAETTGEGAQAVPYYANGWELGVEHVNEEGGICGQEIDYERLPISPTDNAAAKNTFLSAIDKEADVLAGMPNSATVVALAADVARAATPIIWMSSPSSAFVGAEGSVGNQWGFLIRPNTALVAEAQVDYIVNTLGKKKIGLVCVNQTFGQQGCAAAKPALEAAGAEVVAQESHEITDTNLTSKVLALKNAGVDGIVAFTFPNTGVVLFNQMADNGLNVPIMTGAIAGLATATGNVKEEAVANLYGVDDCAPAVEERAADFAAAYKEKFGSNPTYSAAQAYDVVHLYKLAVEAAGSDDKAAIAKALETIEYEGACTDYQGAESHGLANTVVVEKFDAQGVPTVEETITLEEE